MPFESGVAVLPCPAKIERMKRLACLLVLFMIGASTVAGDGKTQAKKSAGAEQGAGKKTKVIDLTSRIQSRRGNGTIIKKGTLGGWRTPPGMLGQDPPEVPMLDKVLPLVRSGKGKRPPLGYLLYAIERENRGALSKAQYFQMLQRYTRQLAFRIRQEGDPQRRIEQLAFVVHDVFGLRYKPIEATRPRDLFISDLLSNRMGSNLQFVLAYLVIGRAVGLTLYPVTAGDEIIVRHTGEPMLSLVPAQQGDVRPLQYHIRRHNLKGATLPMLTQAQFLGRLFYERGSLLAKSGSKKKALRDFERSIMLQEDHTPTLKQLALLYDAMQQHDKAGRIITKLIGKGVAGPDLYWRRAELMLQRRQWGRAVLDLRTYLKENTDDPRAFHLLGTALEGQNKLPEAVEAYRKAIQLGDENIVSLANARIRAIRGPVLIERFLKSTTFSERINALREMSTLNDRRFVPKLIPVLKDENLRVRWQVAQTLRRILGLSEETYLELGIDHMKWSQWWGSEQKRVMKKSVKRN